MNTKRYNIITNYYRENFNEKVYKIALDIGATCPNRDGSLGHGGCIFCSPSGSGDFATLNLQIEKAIKLLKDKATNKLIAYFQSFSNTYMSVERLDSYVQKVIAYPNICGISISTRPDTISNEMLDYLEKLNQKTHLVVELGLQTCQNDILKAINRGHNVECFIKTFDSLKLRGIKVCVHIMNGLPNQNVCDMLNNIRLLNTLLPHSVKIHCTYVPKGTILEKMYNEGKYLPLEMNEYLDILVEQIRLLDKRIYVERITGDGRREELVAPRWTLNKRYFLNCFDKKLIERDAYQGDLLENIKD